MIPEHIRKHFEEFLFDQHERPVSIDRVRAAGGGSINQAAVLETGIGKFFVKWNKADRYPGMFAAEAEGLEILRATKSMYVPECIMLFESKTDKNIADAFLVLEFLEQKPATSADLFDAGTRLAALHRNSFTENNRTVFGLQRDNYIGSLPQSNRTHFSWNDFFAEERILPQIMLARNSGLLDKNIVRQAERFCSRLAEIFPEENPALLHGDLWSGNFMHTGKGPAIYDPAVYYGHREMDLAMTKLFGGFAEDFYSGYTETFAPEKNWKQRTDYCNLYPLLVHVNLFGGGYVHDVRQILNPFS